MRVAIVLAGLLCLGLLATPVLAQDPVKVDGKHFKVVFENDQVRVLRSSVGPREKSPMHEHPATVVISLGDGKGKFTLADGKTRETSSKAGEALWTAAEKHAYENLSDKASEAILVELKAKPAAVAPPAKAQPPVKKSG